MPVAVGAIGLLVLLTAFVAYGNVALTRSTSEGLGRWLKWVLRGIPQIEPFVSDQAIALARWLSHEIGKHAAEVTHRAVAWLSGLAQYVSVIGYWSLLWPRELFNVVVWLVGHEIPRLLKALPAPIVKVVHGLTKIVKTYPTKIIHLTKYVPVAAHAAAVATIPKALRAYLRELEWLRKHWRAVTAAAAGAIGIAVPFPRVGVKARDWTGLLKRMRRMEKLLGAAGAVALLYRALARLGWKCRPGSRTGKAVCRIEGMDAGILQELLAGTFLIFGSLSLADFVREVEDATPPLVDALGRLIRER